MPEPGNISDHAKTMLYANEFDLLNDELGVTIELLHSLGIPNEFCQAELHKRINKHAVARAYQPFEVPKAEGEFLQGFGWKQKTRVTYPPEHRLRHTLTVTTTGGGKTNEARREILTLLPFVKSIVAIDIRKNEFACLGPLAQKLGYSVPTLLGRELKVNLLQIPDGVSTEVYASNLADVFANALELPPLSGRLLFSCLLHVYEEHEKPTLLDLRNSVLKAVHANRNAREAILNRLDPIMQSLGSVFGYKKGWSTSDLFNQHLVLSLYDLTDMEQNLIINVLLLNEFISAVSTGVTNQGAKILFVIDEAARILKGSTALSSWFPLVRGAGIVLDLYTQYIADGAIAHEIISNCPNKRLGMTGSPKDFDVMARAMSLDQQQKKWLHKNLNQPGHFAMQVAGLARPFLYRVPLLKVPHSGSQSSCSDLEQLPVIPDERMQNWRVEWGRGTTRNIESQPTAKPSKTADPQHTIDFEPKAVELLYAIGANEHQTITYYVKELGVSRTTELDLRKLLLDRKLICMHEVQTKKKRGHPGKRLALTETGQTLLDQLQKGG